MMVVMKVAVTAGTKVVKMVVGLVEWMVDLME